MNRLVVLSGPSCVGKSPLWRALTTFYPDVACDLEALVLYNDRAPRPGEVDGVDYHFRSTAELQALRGDPNFLAMEVRGDLQALDLRELRRSLERRDAIFEGNPFVGEELLHVPHVPKLGVFVAPLARDDIRFIRSRCPHADLRPIVTDIMRRKLLRRTRRQKGELSRRDLDNIETRAASAADELRMACRFDWVLPNHDGEDSENWDAFHCPVGDARATLEAFVALLNGEVPARAEQWEAGLM